LNRRQIDHALDGLTADVLTGNVTLPYMDRVLSYFEVQGYSMKEYSSIYEELLEEWKSMQPTPEDDEDLP